LLLSFPFSFLAGLALAALLGLTERLAALAGAGDLDLSLSSFLGALSPAAGDLDLLSLPFLGEGDRDLYLSPLPPRGDLLLLL